MERNFLEFFGGSFLPGRFVKPPLERRDLDCLLLSKGGLGQATPAKEIENAIAFLSAHALPTRRRLRIHAPCYRETTAPLERTRLDAYD